MSLQDTIKQLRQQLAQWVEQQRQLRRRKLNVVRLEDRRLPDATFALLGNALTLDSFDGGSDGLDVSFNSGTSQLNFTLNSGAWIDGTGGPLDPALNVVGNLLTVNLNLLANTQLSLLQIDGASVLKNVTDAGDAFSINTLNITGESDVVLDGQNDFDVIQVEGKSLTLSDSDDLEIGGLDLSNNAQISATGSLTSSALANLQVANHFEVSGSSIQLTAANEFGSLQFQSTGDVTIFENGSMLLIGTNSADDLELRATNDLADNSTTELLVSQHARFEAASVTITGSFEAGSLSFHATDAVEIHEVDDMDVSSASEAAGMLILEADGSLEVNDTIDVNGDVTLKSGVSGSVSDVILNGKLNATGAVLFEASGGIDINAEIDPTTVTLQANDDITINSGIVATNQITIEAGLDGTGSVELSSTGSLLADNLANTAGVAISSGATTGTITLTGTITADGLVAATSNESIDGSGLITSAELVARAQTGIGSTNALQTAVATLAIRNVTSGDVRIQTTGDLSIANAGSIDGTAGHQLGNFGGGVTQITAASPLTIASNITSVGSMILTAGETSDAPGFADDLQINNGVTVSVTGVGNVLTLQAGDDVSIQGTASATAGNVVVKAGFGDLDGDGAIHFDGSIDAGQLAELTAVTGIQDNVAGTISATSLVLLGSGSSLLDNGHDVSQLAANLSGSLSFRSTNSFDVETIGGTVGIQLTTAGSTLELQANAGTIGLAENLTTLGHQNLQSAVELRDNVTISSGNGDVTFASTVASQSGQAFGLTVNSSGQTVFQSSVGTAANQALGFLTTDAPGSTQLAGDVTTTAEIRFNDSVTLLNDVTLSAVDTDVDGEGIDFGSTLNGGVNNLTIVGGAGFAAAVSNVSALIADHIDSESTISVGTVTVSGTSDLGGNVTTTGEQVYSGAVRLTSNLTLSGADTDADGEGIDFGSTVNGGANDLTIVGGAGFAAAVSNVDSLNADHVDSESTISAGTVSVTGTSALGGNVTTTGEQVYSGAVLLTSDVTLSAVDTDADGEGIDFGSIVNGGTNDLAIVGGAGFAGAVSNVDSLVADRIDSESTISAGTVSVTGTSDLGGNVTTTGEQVYSGAVLLTADVTLSGTDTDADAEGIDFGSTLNGGGNDLNLVGGAGFAAAVSNVGALVADHIDSESTISAGTISVTGTSDLGGSVTTTGEQVYSGAVLLTADVTLSAADTDADAEGTDFGSTVNGGTNNLTIVGGAGFAAAVSNIDSLLADHIDSESTISAGSVFATGTSDLGGNVTTIGEQVYSGAVLITNDATLNAADTDADGEGIDFGSSVNGGANDLTVVGGVGFAASVSNLDTLSADHIDSESTISANTVSVTGTSDLGGNVTTTGEQVYSGAVLLTSDVTLSGADTDADGEAIDFGSTLNGGGNDLTIVGGAGLAAAVSNVDSLVADHIDSESTISAGSVSVTGTSDLGGNVSTIGEQVYSGAVLLANSVTLNASDTDADGEGVDFGSTVNGGSNDLTVVGGVGFAAAVSNVDALLADHIDSESTISANTVAVTGASDLGGHVTTTGEQVYSGAVVLTSNVTLAATDTDADAEGIDFGSTVNGGANDLTIVGGAGFAAAVSNVDALQADHIDSESTISAGTLSVSGTSDLGGNVTTTGEQVFAGAVLLTSNVTLNGTDTDADGEAIDFGATLNGGSNDLTIIGGAGFAAAVSNVDIVAADHIDSESTISANEVSVTGTSDLGGNITTTGEQVYSGAVLLTATVTLSGTDTDADGEAIDFGSTVNGGTNNLTIVGGTGFAGAVSNVNALNADHVDSESTISAGTVSVTGTSHLGGNVTTIGEQVYAGAVLLTNNVTLNAADTDADGEAIDFGSTLNGGANDLTIVGGAGFAAAVSNVDSLNADHIDSETTISAGTVSVTGTSDLGGSVTTTGEQVYTSAVLLTSDVTLSGTDTDADAEGIDFGSTLNGGGNDLNIVGGARFAAAASNVGALVADHIDSESTISAGTISVTGTSDLGGNVTTTGEQVYTGPVLLTSDVTFSAADTDADGEGVDFGLTINGGANDLTIVGGAGFAAAVSNVDALLADHVDSESTISATSVSVTGTSDLGGDVSTTGSQSYSGAVLLTANVELVSSTSQNMTLDSTVDGAHHLTIRTGGVTSLNGDIGGTTQLNELTTDAAGQTRIDAANVKADVIQFNDSVVLHQSVTFDATTSVEFGSSVSGNSGSEDLTITAPTVTFDGAISNLTDVTIDASGQTTFNGGVNIAGLLRTDAPGITKINAATITADTVQFDDAVELCQDTTITADRITFGKTIDEAAAATGSDLTLTITNPAVANGDISIGDDVGATRRLESITVTAGNDVTFQGTVETDGAVIQQSGSGLTTFNGTGVSGIGGNLNITTNNLSFNTSDMTTVGAIVVVAANQILMNASAGLNSGGSTITLRANQDASGAEGLVQQDGSVIATTNASANAVLIDVSGSGSAAINTIQAAGTVTVTVGGSILDNSTAESANVTAAGLALTAQSGIGGAAADDLDTNVANLEASTITGGITISEVNAVTIGGVNGSLTGMNVQSSGDISLTANGSITVAESVNGPDDISLTALGSTSDLTISSGSGVTSTDGDVLLSADRTVTVSASVSTSQSGSISITGNNLAGARNVIVNSGAMISVMNGDLTIDADQGSQQPGNFAGILIDAAELRSTGSGDVILTGRGGDSASGNQSGVDLQNGSVVRSTSNAANAGDISITGIGGANAGDQNSGIAVSSGSQIRTVTGDINLVGTGGNGAGTLNHGIMLDAASVSAVGTSAVAVGDVHLTGTAGSGVGSNAILMSNSTSITVQNSAFTNGATLTLESSVGNVVQNTSATVTADNLQLLGTTTGNFDLAEANNVDSLAASIRGTLDFTDTNALIIGTAGSTSGLNSSNHDVRLTVQSGGLQIGDSIGAAGSDDINIGTADVTLNVSGAVGQTTGNSVTANGLELLGDGSTILEDTGNAIFTFAANYDGAIRFANSQPLTVGSLASSFAATSGITTSNDDVTLCATSIDLAEDVSIGTGTLRLQATTGSVNQSAGAILAGDLSVRASSGITLDSARNDVNLFAADGGSGNVVIVDTDGFTIGNVTANGCFTSDVSGITSGQDFEACVAFGSIHLSGSLNITGTVRLEATTGSVTSTAAGTINAANLAVRAANAIDLNVATNQITGTFAAESTLLGSIEFADADGFTAGTVSGGACVASVDGVTTTDGDILLTTSNGTLTNQTRIIATNGNAEILVTGTGDVLLNGITQATASGHVLVSTVDGDVNVNGAVTSQAGNIRLSANGDVIANASVVSSGGHVSILATDDIVTNRSVTTVASGTIHLSASNQTVDSANDGVLINASLETVDGDVLVNSSLDIRQNASITSTSGDIGLVASRDVTQTTNGDVDTTTGNVLVEAGRDWTMSNGTLISAGGSVDGRAVNGAIALGDLNAAHVAISAQGDVSDANGATLNVVADTLSMRSTNGSIGAAGNAAIDTQVNVLAATAATGIAIQETDGLIVDHVNAVTVTIDIERVNSTGSTDAVSTNRNTQALDDLTTTSNGSILLQTLAGSISLNDGTDADTLSVTAHGTGNVLIETLGAGGNVIVNSGVRSSSGHVTLNAANDVDVNGSVITRGAGTLLIQAANDVHVDAILQTTDGDILIEADRDLRQSAAINSGNGDVGLLASRDVTQTAAGDITTTAGEVLVEAGLHWTMADGTAIIAGGGEVDGKALAGSIALGQIESMHVALSAFTNITDANGAALNIGATTLSLRATNGAIGGPGSAAIETQITTLAASAATGIAIQEADGLTVDHVAAVDVTVGAVNDVNFDGTLSDVTELRNTNALNDLTTTNNGDILLQSVTGSLTLNDGADGDALAVTANGTGNVLIETLAAGGDVIVNSGVHSGNGHVTVNSANDVDMNGSVITGGVGTILIQANNDVQIDGILQTTDGDILIKADRDLHQTAAINSTNGDAGLIASRDVTQTATGDITTTAGDVLVEAGRNWSMSNGTTIIAGGGELDGKALAGDLALGEIRSTNVALTAQGSITDANGATLNVDAATLSMRAITGSIGQSHTTNNAPNLNANAIDTQVTTLAATSGTGIYIEEADGLTIDTVAAVSVSVSDSQQVNFDSTTTNVPESRGTATLEDLTTTSNGPIKVVTLNGSLTLNGGNDGSALSAHGTGDVLLQARGAGSDLIINGTVSSGTRHITLTATNHVDLNATINTAGNGTTFVEGSRVSVDSALTTANGNVLIRSTDGISQTAAITSTNGNIGLIATGSITQAATGDITTTTGDVLVEAGTDWTMSNGTTITAGGGDFDGKALAGNIALGQINALRTALTASGSIGDANGATLNVIGTSLSLRATTGAIGGPGVAALETQIQTLSALAATGISIQELDGLTVDHVAAVSVTVAGIQQVNFNSTTSSVTETRITATLDDLTTTNNGDILLRSTNGSIVLNDGLDGDTIAVAAHGTGDVLIQTAAADGDIIVNGGIRSGSGHVTLSAGDDLDVNQSIITAGNGSLLLKASNGVVGDLLNGTDGISIDALVQSAAGDILLQSSKDLRQAAAITSSSGDIGIVASRDVTQTAIGDVTTTSGNGLVEAGRDWTMSNGTTILAGGGSFDGKALAGSIALGQIESAHVALSASNQITDANTASLNVIAETLSLRATSGAIGGPGAAAIDTQVNVLAATAATGISIDEMDGLSVDHVAVVSVSVNVRQVNPTATTTVITESRNTQALNDLTTTNDGSILLRSQAGSITLNDGTDGDLIALTAHGAGNVLIETLAVNGDIEVNGAISSGTGHITINAGDDVDINASINTAGKGTLLIRAANGSTADAVGAADGISVDAELQTIDGDILLLSSRDIAQSALITSANGDIGLIAGRDITQTATGDINAATGDVLVEAGRDWLMSDGATIIAGGGEVDGKAVTGNIELGQVQSTNVALSANGSITDSNAAGLNIIATTASLRASSGAIGGPGTAAIDTQIQTLAAESATGIFVNELDGLTVDHVSSVTVAVGAVDEVLFDGTTVSQRESRSTQTLDDLTTTNNGPVLVRSLAGSIVLNDGLDGDALSVSADGSGNVLIETLAADGDIVVNAAVESGTGNVSVLSADDIQILTTVTTSGTGTILINANNGSIDTLVDGLLIDAELQSTDGDILIQSSQDIRQNAAINSSSGDVGMLANRDVFQSATGDITTTAGDVLMEAGRDWTMSNGTVINAGGGDMDGKALSGSVALGQVNSTRVALSAQGSITDANAASLNVNADNLSLRATTGAIGAPGAGAIDTRVQTVAGSAATGISINEANGLVVNNVAAVNVSIDLVREVNFNGTKTVVSESTTTQALDDLTTTSNGDILLQSTVGTIVLNDGLDADAVSVSAHGTGNVLMQTLAANGDITTQAGIRSGSGSVTLDAGDDIDVNNSIITGGSGSILLRATNGVTSNVSGTVDGISIDGQVQTSSGDILIDSELDLRQTAGVTSATGDVGLIAARDITQTATGDITATAGDVLVEAGRNWTMSNGTTIIAGGGEVDGKALSGDLALGQIRSTNVALTAQGSITDANGASLNVDATTLSLRAITGSIGQSHTTNNAVNLNVNAIDTQVQTLAATAATGMYIEEADAIIVDNVAAVSVTVSNINEIAFDGTTAAVSETRGTQTLNDLTTTVDGSIKLVSRAGSITVNSGLNGSPGVFANGAGDILLQAESAGSDVILNSDVIATTGHITIDAADSVVIEDDITTGGSGTLFIVARGGSVTMNDADGNLLGIQTADGNILIDAATTLALNATIQSNTGTTALQSGVDILQNADITTGGDLLMKAGRDLRMNSTSISNIGGGELVLTADRDIEIALVEATNVSIEAGRDILDARLAAQTNVRSTTLRMIAGGEIGGANSAAAAGTNLHAIDTEVAVLAAKAANGISIQEVAAGGAIQVGSVADLTVSVTVQRANFNSTTSKESLAETLNGLADLTTTADGDIRLVTVNGAITVNDGSGSVENGTNEIGVRAMGSGYVLLHAGGTTSDLTINADVQLGSGHVTLTADDDVLLNADVRTAGKGTVFVAASNRNAADSNAIVMQNGTSIETAGGNVRMMANREGHLLLSTINASTGSVSLLAEGNILDNNGATTNVFAHAARLVADASVTNVSNGLGMIGGPETGAASGSNVNAIDTQVNILAAQSADGVFVRELDDLTVDATGDIPVEEVNFNSTTTTRTDSSLSDITTTHDGTIRLQSVTGSIVLNDGTDGDNRAISANGTGNILVETLAADGDVTVNSRVQSGTGHVTLSATDDVRISASVSTSAAGTIVIQASNSANDAGSGQTDGIRVDATLTTLDGDILLTSTRDIRVNSAISSTDGNIGLLSGRDVVQTNTGDITSTNSDVLIEAQRHWTMATDLVVAAGGGEMIGTAVTGTITLGRVNADHVALTAGDAIADANGALLNIVGDTASLRAGSMIGTSGDRIETQIDTLAALSGTGVYISEADDLTIDTVSSVNVILADPLRVDFNGSETLVPQTRTTQTLEDVTTTNNGEIHVRTDAGTLTIEGGTDNVGITANGSGDILLEAFGATSDIIANARIISTTGDISVVADRDIVQNNEGDIFTSNADVLIDAGRDWSMSSDAEVRSISGSVGGVTGTGEIALGQISADQVALQSAKSISDSNGVRANVVATTLSMSAAESIGDRNNAGTTPTALADAIDTNVQTIAASSHHGLFINEANSLIVGTVASQTIGGTTFGTQIGLNSDNSDILLIIGQNLTLNQTVNAGTADLRVIANGNVSQSASGIIRADEFGLQQNSTTSGDVTLFSANDVNIIAVDNLFDGGDLTFADADDLIIRTVTSQTVGIITFTGTTGLKATGGDVHIQAQGDVTILRSITSTNGVVDSTGASGEEILIEAVDGNIVIDATAGAIVVSTDEGLGSHAATGDSVTLLADSDRSYSGDLDGDSIADAIDPDMDGDNILNNVDATISGTTEGKVTMLGDVTVASDGGVAKKFGPRPAVGESSTAFFIFTSNPLPVVIDNSPAFWDALNAYIDAFAVEIGVFGEENLTVDIDWRDPANESGVINDAALQLLGQNLGIDNPISSERFQQFLIANGGQMNVIGHLYTANDMTLFQKVLNVTTIVIDLSVSHHESLSIGGAFVEQAGTGQSVPGLDVTSTDNPTNGLGNFDNGVATFKIPTVTPAPAAFFGNEGTIRVDRPMTITPPENSAAFTSLVVGDFGGGAVSGSAFSTEVYFQIRRQFEADGPAEVVVERITDSRLISSREALEKFVRDNPELQDGAGYEIWLISETGGQKVERPVVEFEITGGQPGPASEVEQNSTEVPKLIDLPFEQPEQTPAEPANELPDGTTSLEMDAPNSIDALPVEQPAAATEESVTSIQLPVEFMDESNSLDSTEEASDLGTFGGSASVLTGTIVGLAVNRFRSRQQADPDPPRYSRAARFRRGKEGDEMFDDSELPVRRAGDVNPLIVLHPPD